MELGFISGSDMTNKDSRNATLLAAHDKLETFITQMTEQLAEVSSGDWGKKTPPKGQN